MKSAQAISACPWSASGSAGTQGYTAQRIGPDGYPYDEWTRRRPTGSSRTPAHASACAVGGAARCECRVWRVEPLRASLPLYLLEPDATRDRWITRRLYGGGARTAASPRRSCSASAACARSAALGTARRRLPLQRGPRGVRRARADRDRIGAGGSLRRRPGERRAGTSCSPPTRPVPAGNEVHDLERAAPARRRLRARRRRAGAQIGGDPFNMTVAGLRLARARQRRRRAARRDRAHDVGARRGRRADHRHHQRRARAAPGRTRASAPRAPTRSDEPALATPRATLKRELLDEVAQRTGVAPRSPTRSSIGFARRAAAYKRADLLLARRGALAPLFERRGVQLVFAGKAHPRDLGGKAAGRAARRALAKQLPRQRRVPRELRHARSARCSRAARDVWLNNPRRPLEACGTLGHEGGDERRAQPARSSTAGGRRAASTASPAGPSATAQRAATSRRRARRARALYDAARARGAAGLSATARAGAR